MASTTPQVRSERERAEAAEASNAKLDASLLAERRRRVEEVIAAKTLAAEDVRREREGVAAKLAVAHQRELSARLADERRALEKQLAAQKAAHDGQV